MPTASRPLNADASICHMADRDIATLDYDELTTLYLALRMSLLRTEPLREVYRDAVFSSLDQVDFGNLVRRYVRTLRRPFQVSECSSTSRAHRVYFSPVYNSRAHGTDAIDCIDANTCHSVTEYDASAPDLGRGTRCCRIPMG